VRTRRRDATTARTTRRPSPPTRNPVLSAAALDDRARSFASILPNARAEHLQHSRLRRTPYSAPPEPPRRRDRAPFVALTRLRRRVSRCAMGRARVRLHVLVYFCTAWTGRQSGAPERAPRSARAHLGALRHGVLGELARQQQAHCRLDLARAQRGAARVARQLQRLVGESVWRASVLARSARGSARSLAPNTSLGRGVSGGRSGARLAAGDEPRERVHDRPGHESASVPARPARALGDVGLTWRGG